MKLPFLNIWITRTDWEWLNTVTESYNKILKSHIAKKKLREDRLKTEIAYLEQFNSHLQKRLREQSETYTDKQGRLRYKNNGQFAPDNRSKFKQTHDQLRQEVASGSTINWDDLKKASKV